MKKKNHNTKNGRHQEYVIRGRSMLPFYPPGKKVKLYSTKTYVVGDIIGYLDKKQLIVHRVIAVKKSYLITKGDFNFFIDSKIRTNKVIGKINNNNKLLNYFIARISMLLGKIYSLFHS